MNNPTIKRRPLSLLRFTAALLVLFGGSFVAKANPGQITPSAAPGPSETPAHVPLEVSQGDWLEVPIGIIGPASEDILRSALAEAQRTKMAGILIVLDTPGGGLESTRTMIKEILSSTIPVAVWVGPPGSHAGSAGAFITIAAHIAAMAPGTNVGAAHPVAANGENIQKEMERKVLNDTIALIESIAKTRGRNVDMARSLVSTSLSVTAEEALENKLIDKIARDQDALMKAMNGLTVEMANGAKLQIDTTRSQRVQYAPSFRQQLLTILSNPNLFYLLFLAGLIGLGYELTHPGLIVPGVAGGICLILALIAMSVLPVNFGAAALILVGVAFLIAEAFVPSFGALGIGGILAFVIGSVFLVDPDNAQGLRISWYTIAPGAIVTSGAFLALGYIVMRSSRAKVTSGPESLVGSKGTVLGEFKGLLGQVRVQGAIWRGRAAAPLTLRDGDSILVTGMSGLELLIEPSLIEPEIKNKSEG